MARWAANRQWTKEEDDMIREAAEANLRFRTNPEYFYVQYPFTRCDNPECAEFENEHEVRTVQPGATVYCRACYSSMLAYEKPHPKRFTNRLREVSEKIGRSYAAVCKRASRMGIRSDRGRQRRLPMERAS